MSDTTQLELPEVHGPMSATQLRMMQRAMDILRNLPVQFVVVAPDDQVYKYGDWELVRKNERPSKRKFKYAFGSVRARVKPYLDALEPGGVAHIPVEGFDVDSIQSNIGPYARKLWGEGNYTTARSADHSHVEVYRAV